MISVELGFPDASVVERGGLRARARLCRVEVAKDGNRDAVTGTGFLVGPSTVLTAFHVVADLVDERTRAPRAARSASSACASTTRPTGRKLPSTGSPNPGWWRETAHDDEIETTNGTPELVSPAKNVDLRGFLDYAVIVVAGSPGSERGYYDLAEAVEPGRRQDLPVPAPDGRSATGHGRQIHGLPRSA